jgi:hypothetical protein
LIFKCLMITNALDSVESLAIFMKIATLGILMDSLAYKAVKRGYISEEIRD